MLILFYRLDSETPKRFRYFKYTKQYLHAKHGLKYFLTLSRENVLVTAKPHPASKALRIIEELVAGVALAMPKGFGNFSPAISTLMSTKSIGV